MLFYIGLLSTQEGNAVCWEYICNSTCQTLVYTGLRLNTFFTPLHQCLFNIQQQLIKSSLMLSGRWLCNNDLMNFRQYRLNSHWLFNYYVVKRCKMAMVRYLKMKMQTLNWAMDLILTLMRHQVQVNLKCEFEVKIRESYLFFGSPGIGLYLLPVKHKEDVLDLTV